MLDPLNEVDIFCLHFVYIARVNKCLADFQSIWNCHPLSTESRMSPSQLFVEGLCASERLPEQLDSGLLGPSPSNEETIPEEVAFVARGSF